MTEFPVLHPRTDVTTHGTFVLDRRFDVAPAVVFAAWATIEAKRAWFQPPPGWTTTPHEFVFRPGGAERHTTVSPDGTRHGYVGHYFDIVADTRLVFGYAMDLDGVPLSASLVTVDLRPEGTGTHLVMTEQGAYFLEGGPEIVSGREYGTRLMLDSLERHLGAPGG
jgi:uncharacterized protein YndB with AHSA1/START domain